MKMKIIMKVGWTNLCDKGIGGHMHEAGGYALHEGVRHVGILDCQEKTTV